MPNLRHVYAQAEPRPRAGERLVAVVYQTGVMAEWWLMRDLDSTDLSRG